MFPVGMLSALELAKMLTQEIRRRPYRSSVDAQIGWEAECIAEATGFRNASGGQRYQAAGLRIVVPGIGSGS